MYTERVTGHEGVHPVLTAREDVQWKTNSKICSHHALCSYCETLPVKTEQIKSFGGINIPSMIYFSILELQLGEKRQSGEKCWSLKFAIHYRSQHLLIKQEQQPYF